jgi:copper chaperone CopZ
MSRTLYVSGMSCEGCETSVAGSLRDVGGIEDADADHETGTVTVVGETDDEDVRRAIEEAGYTLEEG